MTRTIAHPCAPAHHISVAVRQAGRPLGCRLIDVRRDHPVLMKELAHHAVARAPESAGAGWTPSARVPDGGKAGCIMLEALRAESEVLAGLEVPVEAFEPIARAIASALGVEGDYEYEVAVHAPDSRLVTRAGAVREDGGDFEFVGRDEPMLRLPGGSWTTDPVPGPRRVIAGPDGWLRCVFRQRAFGEFLEAASRETDRERAWLGLGRVHLGREACEIVIEEGLVELPGESGPAWIVTRGRDWARFHARYADRLVAFMHLHPRTADGKRVAPAPSVNDAVVAWNMEAVTVMPMVYPIAMFGTNPSAPAGDVAAFGYQRGLLTPIRLEVTP